MRNEAGEGKTHRLLGSLRAALDAASRDDPTRRPGAAPAAALEPPPLPVPAMGEAVAAGSEPASDLVPFPSAAEAAREARGGAPIIPPQERHVEFDAEPTTRVVRAAGLGDPEGDPEGDPPARTQLLRGKAKVVRSGFQQDPVVGWLVIVGGPGLGAFRPIYEGNNTVGRAANQRIPLDYGDETISSVEQAFIRYDGSDRSFLFVPNLAKTNVVAVNDTRPTSAVELQAMDVIMMGRTQLVFVPFCGSEFDWSDIGEAAG